MQTFVRRVGPEIAASFTKDQLAAIHLAFGARQIGSHGIDLRRTVGLLGFNFYVVLLLGRESRSADRRRLESPLGRRIASAVMRGSLLLAIVMAVLSFWDR